MGQQREGSGVDDQLITRTVGKQPLVEVVIGGIKVPCLIDTGSQVSMVSESLFKTHLEPVLATSHHGMGWPRLTAAIGLSIPYIGIADLDVGVGGVLVKNRGVVITRQAPTMVDGQEVHGLLGSNIHPQEQQPICQPCGAGQEENRRRQNVCGLQAPEPTRDQRCLPTTTH